ncbi:hypothetical protein [Streptobacillus canis]|uniref:hypothetical protein n=1 Tax=Streptobacillus canis TaxID=2678686 RepID=UPI0012E12E1E|nr:hypothetical protein [Streptobacillus canis]
MNLQENNIYVVAYKDKFTFWSGPIMWWLGHPYSHIEVYKDGVLIGISNDQHVRRVQQGLNPKKWDIFKLNVDVSEGLETFYKETRGKKYDWKGVILTCIFNRRRHNPDKYTCSEWVAEMLDKSLDFLNPKDYINLMPYDVIVALKNKNLIEKVNVEGVRFHGI